MNLDELQRQFAIAPNNERLRAQLIIALRRSGRDSDAKELIRKRFHCPVSWDQLTPTSRLYTADRHCWKCDKSVHFASSLAELTKRGEQNQCVVGPEKVVDEYCERLARQSLPLFRDSEMLPRCLNSSPGKQALREKLKHFPNPISVARHYPNCVPMSPKVEPAGAPETLILVTDAPQSSDTVESFTQAAGVERCEVQFAGQSFIRSLNTEREQLFPEHPGYSHTWYYGYYPPPSYARLPNLQGWIDRKLEWVKSREKQSKSKVGPQSRK